MIGDNSNIVDKEVTDYWLDRTNIRVLVEELPDMSWVITAFGTVIGYDNAIIELSIDGNILTSAKNLTFVTIDFNQPNTGTKIFICTIHSVSIQNIW